MKSKVKLTVILIILAWSVLLAFNMIIASFFTLGSRDFNGNPNSLSTNVIGVLWLIGSLAQLGLAIYWLKQRSQWLFILLVVMASGSFIALAPRWLFQLV